MTETLAQTAAETVAETGIRVRDRVFSGVVSNVERMSLDSGEIVLASLKTVYRGEESVRTLSISGDAIGLVEDLLIEGGSARFWGRENGSYVTVIGRDLTKRTLTRQATPATKAQPTARTGNRYWNEVILPRLNAGKAKKAAERAAAQSAVEGATV